MTIKEIIEKFKENPFQTIHFKEGWFITGVKKQDDNNYILRFLKWVKEVNQSIAGFCTVSIPLIVTDDMLIQYLNKELNNELKKIKERTELNNRG